MALVYGRSKHAVLPVGGYRLCGVAPLARGRVAVRTSLRAAATARCRVRCGRFFKVHFFGFDTPLPGTSTRAIGFRRGGCVK